MAKKITEVADEAIQSVLYGNELKLAIASAKVGYLGKDLFVYADSLLSILTNNITELLTTDNGLLTKLPAKDPTTIATPVAGTFVAFRDSTNSNHLSIKKDDSSVVDIEGGGGGVATTYNEWTTVSTSGITKGSDTTILVTGADWSERIGWGLMVNQVYPTHYITNAVFSGGNTTLTVVGSGAVPTSITTLKVANRMLQSKTELEVTYNYGTFASGDTTNVLKVYGNNRLLYNGQRARILYFALNHEAIGTGSPTLNCNIDGGGTLFTSNLAPITGNVNSGILISSSNNLLSGNWNDIRTTNPTAKTVADGSIGQGYYVISKY